MPPARSTAERPAAPKKPLRLRGHAAVRLFTSETTLEVRGHAVSDRAGGLAWLQFVGAGVDIAVHVTRATLGRLIRDLQKVQASAWEPEPPAGAPAAPDSGGSDGALEPRAGAM